MKAPRLDNPAGNAGRPLDACWSAASELDLAATGDRGPVSVRGGHLASLFTQAGLDGTQVTTLTVRDRRASFDDWRQPFALGAGRPKTTWRPWHRTPGRALRAVQAAAARAGTTIEVTAVAWAATGRA